MLLDILNYSTTQNNVARYTQLLNYTQSNVDRYTQLYIYITYRFDNFDKSKGFQIILVPEYVNRTEVEKHT